MLVRKRELPGSAGSQRKSLVNEVRSVCNLVLNVVGAGQTLVFPTYSKLIGLKGVIGITHKKNKA